MYIYAYTVTNIQTFSVLHESKYEKDYKANKGLNIHYDVISD